MKMKIEIECSPEEARAFFGLPDMAPYHDVMRGQITEHMDQGMSMMGPDAFMKTWFPGNAAALTAMQDFMKQAVIQALDTAGGKRSKDEGGDVDAA